MKAAPEQQLRLLQVQEIDTRLQQVDHARANLAEQQRLDEAARTEAAAGDALLRAETVLSDVRRELQRAETDVEQVRDRAARNQSRLDAGQGTPKDLTALQHELESLARRQSDLEDIELEVMERAEAAEAQVETATAERERAATEVRDASEARASAIASLDAQRTAAQAPRTGLTVGVDAALLALYDRIRESSGGLGAAPLQARRCGGCRLELNPVDLQAIAKAAPDEVVRCEECGRILVRTAESGLPA